MIDTIALNSRGQITLPFRLRKSLGLHSGMKMTAIKFGKSITLQPLPTATKKDVMSLYGSLSPKGKVIDPDTAIDLAKKIKAQESMKNAE